MYRNTWMTSQSIYKDKDVNVICELGEYAYIHLELTDGARWRDKDKIFTYVLRKLSSLGYKQVFCLIPVNSLLGKERKGVSRAERMLNFKRISKSKDYLFLTRRTNV